MMKFKEYLGEIDIRESNWLVNFGPWDKFYSIFSLELIPARCPNCKSFSFNFARNSLRLIVHIYCYDCDEVLLEL